MMPSRLGRYLSAQTALEHEALRAFAELVAGLALRGAAPAVVCAEHARAHAIEIANGAVPDARQAALAWEIHAWLVDTLTHEERAEVTSAMASAQPADERVAALAKRITPP